MWREGGEGGEGGRGGRGKRRVADRGTQSGRHFHTWKSLEEEVGEGRGVG